MNGKNVVLLHPFIQNVTMNGKAKGYVLGAIAAATYGTNSLFALPLYQNGIDPDSVLFDTLAPHPPPYWAHWNL